jgi:hypothetical protein
MSQDEFGQLYWNGVRDALRMVETFVFWKEKNPREKRMVKDFVSEALEAVRQKCAPCLKEILGINFGPVEEEAARERAFKFAPELTPEEVEPVEEEPEPEPLEEPAPEPVEEPMPEPLAEPESVEERVASRQPDVFLAPEEEAEPELPTPEPEETRAPGPKPFADQDVSRPSPAAAAPKPAEPEEKEKPKRRTFFF